MNANIKNVITKRNLSCGAEKHSECNRGRRQAYEIYGRTKYLWRECKCHCHKDQSTITSFITKPEEIENAQD